MTICTGAISMASEINVSFADIMDMAEIRGSFNDSLLSLSEESHDAVLKGRLRISIGQFGQKPTISGANVRIGSVSGHVSVLIGDDDASVRIGDKSRGRFDLRLWDKSAIRIGSHTTSNGIRVVCKNSSFECGDDCMFSDGILIQTTDQHGLVDLESGTIFNAAERIVKLENHVWVGRNATILSDVNVGEGSVIGACSVVTSDIPSMAVAAGVPAKVTRTNTTWSRHMDSLDTFAERYVREASKMGYALSNPELP